MPTTVPNPRPTPYLPHADACDEAYDRDGWPRPQYADLLKRLESLDLADLSQRSRSYLASKEVAFRTKSGLRPFLVDPVPRLLQAQEWRAISAGLEQRVRALNEFLLDAYGERAVVADGVIPERVIDGAEYYEPDLAGFAPPGRVFIHISGMDLVRGNDDRLRVLEDNLRSPSGLSFAAAARQMSQSVLDFSRDTPKLDVEVDFSTLADVLRSAAPEGCRDPQLALVSDGPSSPAWFEHQAIARKLTIPLITPHQLEQRGGVVGMRIDDHFQQLDVLYRRTNLDRLRTRDGKLTRYGELLLAPLRAGTVAVVNSFGSGVADDKLTHAYVDDFIRYYLNEPPLLESVKTYDPIEPGAMTQIKSRIAELVLKPRGGLGGTGVMIGSKVGPQELATMRSRLISKPQRFVAQEIVQLSTHPTVVRSQLEPRHIDLRPYTVLRPAADKPVVGVMNSCLTRVAFTPGGMIVNSSSNGGSKDTWIAPK